MNAVNADGQITQETRDANITVERSYNAASGRLDRIITGGGAVQDLDYDFDALGNLQGLWEGFDYDDLNRVEAITTHAGSGSLSKTIGYDGLGNITTKSGIGTYTYDPARPHVVATAGEHTYTHDANGNMVSGADRTFIWNQANLPTQISKGNKSLSFSYGPDRARFKQVAVINGGTETTFYVGGLYEKIVKGSLTTHRHSIQANGATVALYIQRSNGDDDVRYLFGDHLGCIDTITNRAGTTIVERLSYDAWGKRRDPNWDDSQGQLSSTVQDRGFTGHEHLDDLNLIHMNGRVYYPSLGRFVSADPTVQYPKYSQSLNRYSYVVNNPLSYTDPSGFGFFSELLDFHHKIDPIQRSLDNIVAKSTTLQQIGGVAAGVASAVWGQPWIAAAYSAHITNLKGGSTGDIVKAGAIAGAAAYAGQYVATSGWTADVQILGYIGIGTAAGVASGGDVGRSFAAAAITAGASAYVGQSGVNPAVGYIVSATLGGTASEISGGKFANGAITGAFGYAVGEAMRRASGPPGRALTTDEIAAAREVFGDKINYDSVRIIDDKYFFLQSSDVAMAPDGNIYWPGECGNLATCQGGAHVGTYIHEMTHVLQYQHGVNVLVRGFFLQASYRLSFGLYNPYDFTYDPSRAFSSYNIEQQGDIARSIYFGRYRNNIDYCEHADATY